jgi:hypothetical protein
MVTRTFEELLANYPSDVQTLARRARGLIREVLSAVDESVDRSGPYVSYGYGLGYSGAICTLILSKSGVKLGFVGGAALADSYGLLEGSGTRHRHVVLKTASDLRQPGLKQLLRSAARTWRGRNGSKQRASNRRR